MKTIWKFPLGMATKQHISMPADAVVLYVGKPVGERPAIWAIVEDSRPTEVREFHVLGTGWEMDETGLIPIGTFLAEPYVWHVFEAMEVSSIETAPETAETTAA